MSTVAEQLRAAREARNWSVEKVAEITKMRTDHVRAIEEGNYSAFSAPVYIRGFVRTYSRLLKLDEKALLNTLESEMGADYGDFHGQVSLSQPKGVIDLLMLQLSKLDWRKALAGAAVITLLVIGFLSIWTWKQNRSKDPLKQLEPGVYQAPDSTVETLPLGR